MLVSGEERFPNSGHNDASNLRNVCNRPSRTVTLQETRKNDAGKRLVLVTRNDAAFCHLCDVVSPGIGNTNVALRPPVN